MDFDAVSYQDEIENEYFNWLYDYVCRNRVHDRISYRNLFMLLHDTEFIFSIPNDENRAADGIDLRYRFYYDVEEKEGILPPMTLKGPCSVLEMMIALAIRCEEDTMSDTRYGDRTSQWFWNMMSNLGLNHMTDDVYDHGYARERIDRFLYREYEPNGRGGLFYIRDCEEDLRDYEIWIQLCWYLDKFV